MPKGLNLYSNFMVGKNEVGKTLDANRGRLKRFEQSAKRVSINTGSIFKGVLGANLVTRGITSLTAGIAAAGREFVSFDKAIISAGAKFGPAFAKGTEGAKELTKVTRGIGAATEFSATQAAQGLDFLSLAGFNAKQSIALLPGVVNLATATQSDLARATDIASDSLGAFGLMSKDSAVLGANLSRVMDVMAKTTTTANTNMEDLFEAVKKGAPSFTTSGQSIESFSAIAGELANSGLKGAEAGTALRNMMLRLSKPTKEAGDVIRNLGVRTQDSEGNFRDVLDILADFEKGLKGMGSAQRTAALSTVFGARTVNSVNVALKAGTLQLRQYRDSLIESKSASNALAESMRTSLEARLAKLKSSAIELGFKFFDAFGPQIESGIESVQALLNTLNNDFSGFRVNLTATVGALRYLGSEASRGFDIALQGLATLQVKAENSIAETADFLRNTVDTTIRVFTNFGSAISDVINTAIEAFRTFDEKVASIAKSTLGFFAFRDRTQETAQDENRVLGGGGLVPAYTTPNTQRAETSERTESLEKKESVVKLIPPDGWKMEPEKSAGTFSTLTLGENP